MVRFSRRLPSDLAPSPWSEAAAAAQARGGVLDLTESNPTRLSLAHAAQGLGALLARPEIGSYQPEPRGALAGREAIAAWYGARGVALDPARVLLTSGTSESYGLLFKLLGDPGDDVLVPRPGYPLLETLLPLDGLVPCPYRLHIEGPRWALDLASIEDAIGSRTAAVVLVQPGNPTGTYLRQGEARALEELCAARGLPIVCDEVFADYAFADTLPAGALATVAGTGGPALRFALGGLSKAVGLPQLKLGWILVDGPPEVATRALARLEHIADAYLSVATPVQAALGDLLALARPFQAALRRRCAAHRAALAAALPGELVAPADAGWYAVLRLPEGTDDESCARHLLERHGVLVHPGFLFDFDAPALVVSLIPEPEVFEAGVARLARALAARP